MFDPMAEIVPKVATDTPELSEKPNPLNPLMIVIDGCWAGLRLDALLAELYPDRSRTALAKAIKSGAASLDGQTARANSRVRAGQSLFFEVPFWGQEGELCPITPMDLEVIYRDDDIWVINKPAGLTVHPADGHVGPTLAGALLALDPGLSGVGSPERPGIVHRLDKDTSGVMVVARNQASFDLLCQAFADRKVGKRYLAFVRGQIPDRGKIDSPIGRHPTQRHKMRAGAPSNREATTIFRTIRRYPKTGLSLVAVNLLTGRTHQARVHLASIGAPILADKIYGRSLGSLKCDHPSLKPLLARQFLHARRLTIPMLNGGQMIFRSPWPPDFRALLEELLRLERENCLRP
ncbi:MAG: RluA family pseudouridine synthase [Deltaproteobacteria bacterium]|jgi:23S rRNA pseudouridine1911/1915/1917 synthase|nr:RluA family pseudouridine synthase [Deltaproteobacteria bacterium]